VKGYYIKGSVELSNQEVLPSITRNILSIQEGTKFGERKSQRMVEDVSSSL